MRDNRCGRCGWLDKFIGLDPDPETISFCELILKNVGVPSIVFTIGFNRPPRSNSCADIFLWIFRNETKWSPFSNEDWLFISEVKWIEKTTHLTGVVAPDDEPPLDELFGAFPCIGDGNSLLPEFACDISHESTSCLVAFLQKVNWSFYRCERTMVEKRHFWIDQSLTWWSSLGKILDFHPKTILYEKTLDHIHMRFGRMAGGQQNESQCYRFVLCPPAQRAFCFYSAPLCCASAILEQKNKTHYIPLVSHFFQLSSIFLLSIAVEIVKCDWVSNWHEAISNQINSNTIIFNSGKGKRTN